MTVTTWADADWENMASGGWRRLVRINEEAYEVRLPEYLRHDSEKTKQIESDIEQIITSLNDKDACEENKATGEKVWKKEVENDVITVRRQPWKDRTSVTSPPDA